jgi:predicted aspartyl protease
MAVCSSVILSMPVAAQTAASPDPIKSESFSIYTTPERVLAMLRVGDNPPVPVVFDTGTSGNIVDRKLATRYGLPEIGPSTAMDGSLGKLVPGFETMIKGASLGGVAIANGPANAIDYDLTDEMGVFGPNSFPGRLVRMDLAAGRVTIEAKTAATIPAGPALAYNGVGDDALPSVELDFGTQKVIAELDTGNNAELLLPLSLAKTLSLEAAPTQAGWATSAAGRQPVYRAKLNGQIKIGPLTLDHPMLKFIEGGRPNAGLPLRLWPVRRSRPLGQRVMFANRVWS